MNHKQMSSKGGRSRSRRKLKAVRENLRKARLELARMRKPN